MNPFNLLLQRLGLPAPLQVQLPAETLIAWQQTHHLTRWVRRRAAQRLIRVRQRRLEVRQAAREYVQRMRKRSVAQTTQLFEQTRIQAIQETIQWLVPAQQLESALANHLAKQAAQWAVEALKQLVDTVDQPRLLLRRLHASIRELQPHGRLTLRVHPTQVEALQQSLSKNDLVIVVADQQLEPLQALLESPLVVIKLDLEQHITLLIEQLLALPPLEAASNPRESMSTVEGSPLITTGYPGEPG
jgi:flagellar biosynthesis/type III secretory pathway protein FliH